MRVSVTLSSLAALLLLGGARAACGGGRRPEITVAGPTVRKCLSLYCAEYGGNIEVFCSFHKTGNLTIRRTELSTKTETELPTAVLNASTILSSLRPTLGWYTYICRDSNSDCAGILSMIHQPEMRVSSPYVHLHIVNYEYHYFVPHEDDFQVICAAPEYETLHIYNYAQIEVYTETVNDTSVVYSAQADQVGKFYYACRAMNHPIVNQHIYLTVDHFPEVYNFSCIKYDFKNKVECSWRTSSAENKFKLFYGEEVLCSVMAAENKSFSGCQWKNIFRGRTLFDDRNQNVSLVMQSCNDFICNNQTFGLQFNSIIKINPIHKITVSTASSLDVFLSWVNDKYKCNLKVEYRLLLFGEPWLQADTMHCGNYYGICKFRLSLPYPDSKYEVKVRRRYVSATDDRHWSDPTSVSVVTKPRAECGCEAGDHEPAEPRTPSEAVCEACELTEHIIKKSKALRQLKSSLKKKRERWLNKMEIIEEMNSLSSKLNAF